MDNYHHLNKSPNVTDTTNSWANIVGANFANQEDKNYDDWQEQQFVACKYNGGLGQVTLELAPNIIVEEKEMRFHQWADQYDQWDNSSYTPIIDNDAGSSHTFNVDNPVFNLTKIKQDGTSKTRVVSKLSESSNRSDFYIGECQS